MRIIDELTNALYPVKCVFCDNVMQVGAELEICEDCAPKIPFFMSDYLMVDPAGVSGDGCDRVICALKHTKMVKNAIKKYKFNERAEFGKTFGALLAEKIRRVEGLGVFDIVTAIPLTGTREKERGYNQANIIAEYVAMSLGTDFNPGLLVKSTGTLRQSGLNKAERERNARGSFSLSSGAAGLINGSTVLLIDDISTTLSTINAAASALKKGGAAVVVGAVVTSGMAGNT